MSYVNCNLCPRQCGVDRTSGETGYCGCPDTALVAKAMIHQWEEPVLAGSGGSGTIFFGGCTLGCKYCQNRAISGGPVGKPVTSQELRAIMEDLIAQGAENIDLVTPTHFLPTLIPALSPDFRCRWFIIAAAMSGWRRWKSWRGWWIFICRI